MCSLEFEWKTSNDCIPEGDSDNGEHSLRHRSHNDDDHEEKSVHPVVPKT